VSSLRTLAAFGSGALFGVGLIVSGMSDPAKVRGFLDVFGAWDPSLAFVMAGAIGVHAPLVWLVARRRAPFAAHAFSVAPKRRVDGRLVLGSAIFGVGWGASGYCPGPALVSLPAAGTLGVLFVLSLLLGSWLVSAFERLNSGAAQENNALPELTAPPAP
jgi:uncharacterized membrane protein YedE/YeeE